MREKGRKGNADGAPIGRSCHAPVTGWRAYCEALLASNRPQYWAERGTRHRRRSAKATASGLFFFRQLHLQPQLRVDERTCRRAVGCRECRAVDNGCRRCVRRQRVGDGKPQLQIGADGPQHIGVEHVLARLHDESIGFEPRAVARRVVEVAADRQLGQRRAAKSMVDAEVERAAGLLGQAVVGAGHGIDARAENRCVGAHLGARAVVDQLIQTELGFELDALRGRHADVLWPRHKARLTRRPAHVFRPNDRADQIADAAMKQVDRKHAAVGQIALDRHVEPDRHFGPQRRIAGAVRAQRSVGAGRGIDTADRGPADQLAEFRRAVAARQAGAHLVTRCLVELPYRVQQRRGDAAVVDVDAVVRAFALGADAFNAQPGVHGPLRVDRPLVLPIGRVAAR